jgi:hypothetical protein
MLTNKQRISTAARQLVVLENPAVQVALVAPENPVAPAAQVALAVPENLAAPAVQVALENPAVQLALAVLENLAAPAVRVVLENPAVQVALAVLENLAVPAAQARQQAAAPVRQVVAALLRQVRVAQKEAQTRSVVTSPRAAAGAVAPSLVGVGALLKPRAIEVAVA